MEHILQIHLLGLPRILLGNSRIDTYPTEKAKLLFFYLLLFRNVGHTRSRLAGLFWGDSSETQARRALSTALWRLRQWLKSPQLNATPLLLFDDQQVAFNTSSPTWFDVAEFEAQITRAKQMVVQVPQLAVGSFERAIELYRGELLEGCYADWCLIERNRLHELYLQALLHLMVFYGGRHEYEQAIGYAKRILTDDPLREDVQRELMKLFVLDQQPAEALLQYRRCETVLREELGIDPMPETQVLFRQLVLGSVAELSELSLTRTGTARATPGLARPILQEIDAAMVHFEVAREEIAKAIEALAHIKSELH